MVPIWHSTGPRLSINQERIVSEFTKAVALDFFYPKAKACSPEPRALGCSVDSLGITLRLCGNCSKAPSPTFNSNGVKALFLFKPLLTITLSGRYPYVPLERDLGQVSDLPKARQWMPRGASVNTS